MTKLDEFLDIFGDATKKLFEDIGDACRELADDLNDTMTVKYLRPGGIVCCKADTGKEYAVLLGGNSVAALNEDGTQTECSLREFLDKHTAKRLWVASRKRIALGANEIVHRTRMELDEERYPSSKLYVLHCLNQPEAESVNAALEERFGSFEWLRYEIPEESTESEESEESEETNETAKTNE